MVKIITTNERIIFQGHADTKQECETISLMCEQLKNSEAFKTIKYESGYAEFEKVGKTEELKFKAQYTVYNYDGSEFLGGFDTKLSDVLVAENGLYYANDNTILTLIPNLAGIATEPNGPIIYSAGDIIPRGTTYNFYAKQSTPSIDTDTKPIFKRINGTWVKQDAFQRVSGAWVRISTKEAGNLLTTSNDETLQDSNENNLEFTEV